MISRAKRRALATFALFLIAVSLFLTVACDQNMDIGHPGTPICPQPGCK